MEETTDVTLRRRSTPYEFEVTVARDPGGQSYWQAVLTMQFFECSGTSTWRSPTPRNHSVGSRPKSRRDERLCGTRHAGHVWNG